MSTRRARIKAVAVLPPRRKNPDNTSTNKNKPTLNDPLKSPKGLNSDPLKSPKALNSDLLRSPKALNSDPLKSPKALTNDPIESPKALSDPIKSFSNPLKSPKDLNSDPIESPKTLNVDLLKSLKPLSNDLLDSPKVVTDDPCDSTKSLNSNLSSIPSPVPVSVIKSPIPQSPKLNFSNETVTSPKLSNVEKEHDRSTNSIIKSPAPIFNSRNSPIPQSAASNVPFQNLSSIQEPQKVSHGVDSLTKDNLAANIVSDANEKINWREDNSITDTLPTADDAAMDGVSPIPSDPKLTESLRNEITTENTEVAFDPIVPLPSPSKVRLKLKPIPRLGPHRRNSVQGSASESEDESRRALLSAGSHTPAPPPRQRHDSHTSQSVASHSNREPNRIRNDSVCSNVSQIHPTAPTATSPVKEKHLTKARRQEMSKRLWRRRRETNSQALTMYDLIFFNPTSNPIVPDEDELKAKEENEKEEAERKAKKEETNEVEEGNTQPSAAPVPQLKLGPNGEIVLDESSLVIKQSETRKVSSVVREGAWGGGGGRYRRAARTADWSAAETVRFYRALAALGTDFSLMAQLFPDRNRRELKLKFKKEEKLNGFQVDKALRSATTWDAEQLESDFREERAAAARKAEEEKQKLVQEKQAEKDRIKALKDMKQRLSKASKTIENTVARDVKNEGLTTADEFIQRALELKQRAEHRKRKPIDYESPSNTSTPDVQTVTTAPEFATLSLTNQAPGTIKNNEGTPQITSLPSRQETHAFATISRVTPQTLPSATEAQNKDVPNVPTNVENGSLVVIRVNDPKSPTKTMLQTYIARGSGKLTPIALPQTLLNSVMGYMNKKNTGTPKSSGSSSNQISPIDLTSSSRSSTSGVIQAYPGPVKRQRHSSYNITTL